MMLCTEKAFQLAHDFRGGDGGSIVEFTNEKREYDSDLVCL